MRNQARRPIALMLCGLLLAAVPAQADPIEYRDVVSFSTAVGRSGGPSADFRLRSYAPQQGKSAARTTLVPGGGPDAKVGGASVASQEAGTGDSLTGAGVAPQDQQTTVETIELGEVNGTLCDCGEIAFPGGAFPLWPLLGFAAVPLFFLPARDADILEDFPIPPTPATSTPTPAPVPEPATLLLFGSGLAAIGAGARRRRARQSKLQQAAAAAREV